MIYRLTPIACVVLFIISLSSWKNSYIDTTSLYHLQGKAQGTTYAIKYIATSQLIKSSELDSIFSVFDHSLSRYHTSSLLTALNKPKRNQEIDKHLQSVLQSAMKFKAITNGCFDYRLLSLRTLWGFESNDKKPEPSLKMIKQKLDFLLFNDIKINELNILKSSRKLTIDLDGIAQGYCVDYLAQYVESKGIEDYIIELGGEIAVAGRDMDKGNWTIGISDATYLDDKFSVIQIAREGKYAVTSSGSFQQYRKTGNKLVSHIIDPRTGYPVQHGIISVTVMATTAIEADALDNAFMVMGIKETFDWLKKYPNIGVYMSYIDENGEMADTANSYFKQYMVTSKND